MAKLTNIIGATFDAAAVEPSQGFSSDALPPGNYTLEIVDADVAPTKRGNGQLLKLSLSVIDPEPYARRRIWENLCISHENPETERIAQSKLSALCRALGIGQLDDTDDLVGQIVRARVRIKPASGGYAESNEVVAYESAAAPTPARAARAYESAAAPTPARAARAYEGAAAPSPARAARAYEGAAAPSPARAARAAAPVSAPVTPAASTNAKPWQRAAA